MAEAVNQVQNEFWRAPVLAAEAVSSAGRSSTCRCGTEFIVSSLYCHACGASRPDLNAGTLEIPGLHELSSLGERLGLTTVAAIAFLLGVLCVGGALAVSVFFSARTVLQWQAIQMWRMEWLLAAIASFVAGLLLKKYDPGSQLSVNGLAVRLLFPSALFPLTNGERVSYSSGRAPLPRLRCMCAFAGSCG